jgi:plastocyanin
VSIDNFTFSPKELKVKSGTTVTWTNHDDIPHGIASSNNALAKSKALDTDDSYPHTVRSSWKRQRAATPCNNATIGSL